MARLAGATRRRTLDRNQSSQPLVEGLDRLVWKTLQPLLSIFQEAGQTSAGVEMKAELGVLGDLRVFLGYLGA